MISEIVVMVPHDADGKLTCRTNNDTQKLKIHDD